MGDGNINRGGKNPRLEVEMVSKNYLQYISDVFGILGGEVRLTHTAAESAKDVRQSGLGPNAKKENYSDVYRWRSISHPEMHKFASWYKSGEKVWPKDINLTPTVLKHWYCGDGHWHNSNSKNHIKIAMSNEADETKKVSRMFESAGLPSPSNYNICKIKTVFPPPRIPDLVASGVGEFDPCCFNVA